MSEPDPLLRGGQFQNVLAHDNHETPFPIAMTPGGTYTA